MLVSYIENHLRILALVSRKSLFILVRSCIPATFVKKSLAQPEGLRNHTKMHTGDNTCLKRSEIHIVYKFTCLFIVEKNHMLVEFAREILEREVSYNITLFSIQEKNLTDVTRVRNHLPGQKTLSCVYSYGSETIYLLNLPKIVHSCLYPEKTYAWSHWK